MTVTAEMISVACSVYVAVLSIISASVTAADKIAARHGRRRVPENTLILIAALGGSAAMLITMLIVRHKTRHIKFMLGIPIIILFQTIVGVYVSELVTRLL